ncbi:cytochrome oxidase assembly protein-domain-containing protein [Dipodascopsis uninucleata]
MCKELARPFFFFTRNATLKNILHNRCSRLEGIMLPNEQFTQKTESAVKLFQKTSSKMMGEYGLFNSASAFGTQTVSSFMGLTKGRNKKTTETFQKYSRRLFSMGSAMKDAENATLRADSVSKNMNRILTDRKVGLWLIGSSALVFGIVVIGGLTRLTESGLSITEWKPVTGSIPPLTEEDWIEEFEKYKSSPEYKLLNSSMTIDEFKFIFFMEWSHRLWGRMIGLLFVFPGAYFILRRKTSPRVTKRIIGIAGLIGFQGFIGWWMVASGLDEKFLKSDGRKDKFQDNHPRVSAYRLATHLGAAFIVYLSMLWTGLEVLRENKLVKSPASSTSLYNMLSNPAIKRYRFLTGSLLGLVFVTAMSGAFVAGLDAGLIYNEFPYMGESIFPPKSELFTPFYARKDDNSDLFWRNILENPVTVQLNHRILATTTFCCVIALHLYSSRLFKRGLIPRNVYRGSHGALGFACLQVTLGITTLLYLVPIPLAAAHQAGSLALLTQVVIWCLRLRIPRPQIVKLLNGLTGTLK